MCNVLLNKVYKYVVKIEPHYVIPKVTLAQYQYIY